MTFLAALHDLAHYQKRNMKVLSPEEQDLYLNTDHQLVNIEVTAADYQFFKEHRINVSRIGFFLFHEWLMKKKAEWGLADGEPDTSAK